MDTLQPRPVGSLQLCLLVSAKLALRDPRTRASKLSTDLQKVPRLSQEMRELQGQEPMLLTVFPWQLEQFSQVCSLKNSSLGYPFQQQNLGPIPLPHRPPPL